MEFRHVFVFEYRTEVRTIVAFEKNRGGYGYGEFLKLRAPLNEIVNTGGE
jgi:hypothetical protein